jgi:hypothetical protein
MSWDRMMYSGVFIAVVFYFQLLSWVFVVCVCVCVCVVGWKCPFAQTGRNLSASQPILMCFFFFGCRLQNSNPIGRKRKQIKK